jgi:hypothetical protein
MTRAIRFHHETPHWRSHHRLGPTKLGIIHRPPLHPSSTLFLTLFPSTHTYLNPTYTQQDEGQFYHGSRCAVWLSFCWCPQDEAQEGSSLGAAREWRHVPYATDHQLTTTTGGRKHRRARPGSRSEVHGRSPPEAHERDVQGDLRAR